MHGRRPHLEAMVSEDCSTHHRLAALLILQEVKTRLDGGPSFHDLIVLVWNLAGISILQPLSIYLVLFF